MNTHRSVFLLVNFKVVGLKVGLKINLFSITVHVLIIYILFYVFVTAWFVWSSRMENLSFMIIMPALCLNLILKLRILMIDFNKELRWLTS